MISIQLKRVFMFLINYLFVLSWGFIWAENCLNLLQKIITFLYHHFILSACLQTYKTTKMTFNIYNKNFTLLKLLFVFLKPHFNCCYCVIFENRPLRWVWLKGSALLWLNKFQFWSHISTFWPITWGFLKWKEYIM